MNLTKNLAIIGLAAVALTANADQFRLTITNTGPQPLSPLFFAASDEQFNIFTVGAKASLGIKNVAEQGNATVLASFATDAGSHVGFSTILGGSPLVPGQTRTMVFTADAAHPNFSFAAMLGKTNDGFIGESLSSAGLTLFENGHAKSIHHAVYGSRAWDAGTELNTQSSADLGFKGGSGNPPELDFLSVVHVHPGVVAGIGDSWIDMPNWTHSTVLARISVEPIDSDSDGNRPSGP